MKNKKKKEEIIKKDLVAGTYLKSVAEIEDVILAAKAGTDMEKLSTFIFLLCDSDKDMYSKTIDLLTTIDSFKNKLKNEEN